MGSPTCEVHRFTSPVGDEGRVPPPPVLDSLTIFKRLKFAGVRVIYVAQGIDSSSEQAELLIGVHGIVDSLYSRGSRVVKKLVLVAAALSQKSFLCVC
jgi:hypothetical protein